MRRSKLALLAVGVAFAAAGLWVITTPTFINEGNQCGANGCMNVSANIPSVGPGILLFIVGFIIVVYGLSRKEGEEDYDAVRHREGKTPVREIRALSTLL